MTLILHCGGQPATIETLADIPTPPATDTYHPVGHHQLAQLVRHAVTVDMGATIARESYGTNISGAQMFGTITLEAEEAEGGLRPTVGFRNSIDKSIAVGLAAGGEVLVCDNLCIGGDVTVLRKHTKNIMPDLVKALAHLAETALQGFDNTMLDAERMRSTIMGNHQAWSIIGIAYGEGILGTRQVVHTYREWRKPSHEEFAPRTAWGLYNAATDALKSSPPGHAMGRYRRLHQLMTLHITRQRRGQVGQ